MVTFQAKGSFRKTKKFLERSEKLDFRDILERYAIKGVNALSVATPKDTRETSNSWGYEVQYGNGTARIYWTNSNINDGVPIAVILQYGHATGNGGWVEGRDYINPAIQPIFDEIAEKAWKEVNH